jgi:hypothetical protein
VLVRRNSFEHKKMMKMLKDGGEVTGDVSAAMRARVEKRAARSRYAHFSSTVRLLLTVAYWRPFFGFSNNKGPKARARPKPKQVVYPSYSLSNSPRDGFGLGLQLNVEAANNYDGELGLPSLPTPLPMTGGSGDVEMTLDALAALAPPTPSFFDGLGDWKWPRSCRTPKDFEGNALGITPTDTNLVADEGKRMYGDALAGSPSKKQRTPKGFTPRGTTPSASDPFSMEEVRITSPTLCSRDVGYG